MDDRKVIKMDLAGAGRVKRYHTWPMSEAFPQTVADHSWHVLRIYFSITPEPNIDAVASIVFHDCGELVAGDPPYPIKAQNPTLKAEHSAIEARALQTMLLAAGVSPKRPISTGERDLVKVCDLIEMAEVGLHQVTMGNAHGRTVAVDCLRDVMNRVVELDSTHRRRVCIYLHTRLSWFEQLIREVSVTEGEQLVLAPMTWLRASNG